MLLIKYSILLLFFSFSHSLKTIFIVSFVKSENIDFIIILDI